MAKRDQARKLGKLALQPVRAHVCSPVVPVEESLRKRRGAASPTLVGIF